MSPSALIPFCEFGGSMSLMGTKINQFSMPVCTSFEAKILHDKLCYQVDVDKYKRQASAKGLTKFELTLLIDSNKERFITSTERKKNPVTGDNIGELLKNFFRDVNESYNMIFFSFKFYCPGEAEDRSV